MLLPRLMSLCPGESEKVLRPHGLGPARLLCPWNFPGKNAGVGSLSLFQGIFPSQESNRSLLHCRRILYHYASTTIIIICSPLNAIYEGLLAAREVVKCVLGDGFIAVDGRHLQDPVCQLWTPVVVSLEMPWTGTAGTWCE